MAREYPVWLGSPRRPLFAWFHCPDSGRAHAGAVICPPLGFDYVLSHDALRKLAEHLADAGFCAIRIDYDGTGDSAGGNDDPGRRDAWLATITVAVEALTRAGVTAPCLIGMRIGATLAAEFAARDRRVDQLVLWDACPTGRSFLAEQRATSTLALHAPPTSPDGSVEIPGFVFDAATEADLRRIAIGPHSGPLARRVLVLTRRDRPDDPAAHDASLGREAVTVVEAVGQAALMDRTAPDQELPATAIRNIVAWLDAGASPRPFPVRVPTGPPRAVVGHAAGGRRIVETAVTIPPIGLFGLLTESERSIDDRRPTVIFLNVATEPHIGPARLWVELARRWAAAGMRSLRMDLSGLGDSPYRRGDDGPWACFKPEAFDDVADAARWVSPSDPSNVVLVGLCASAYQALESGLALGARGVVAINPYVSFVPPEHRQGLPLDARRRMALPKDGVARTFREGGRFGSLRERFPDLAWRVRALGSPRRSTHWLPELIHQGTDTLIVAGDQEARPIRQGITASRLRALERTGLLHFEQVTGLQHGLLLASHRRMVTELVSAHVLSRFAPAPAPPATGDARTASTEERSAASRYAGTARTIAVRAPGAPAGTTRPASA